MFTPCGVIPALVTPLSKNGELLEGGLREVIDFTIENGVHGVFVLGSSGEIFGLNAAQKQRVVEIAVEHVNGRVPVYAGASEITTRDAVATAKMAQAVGGVSALSVLTPYFMRPTQAELIEHYTEIAAATQLPILLYNNPNKTMVDLALPTVLKLSTVDNIIGIKDSSGDLTMLNDILYSCPADFSVLVGKDTLIFSALVNGAVGAIASTGNVAPRLVASIYEAVNAGQFEHARRLQGLLNPLRALLDKATFPVVLKEGLRLQGVDAGYCFAPARELSEQNRAALRTVIDAINAANLS